ncbi:hydroxymethylglutaryl-CoA lyase [Pikeienuella piscinae]|uniref:Hydroxymethylglutaryl-CoA lyase n=1 Tax=Pikeienuella piscinae TaxID=2748098 RepID=A0A7L5BV51_9RHOB|nr:hydroxymethylglutaryl-CoA lyase [Pikeienuella piscinae]QIE54943.1 hydroxymethylglutaryl-CoA lyase [Pikeienuella piscinae]
MPEVEIVEVGPRDGLQNIATFVPTETKVEFIRRLIDAGFKRMELGSFVSPSAIPQMRDMEEVIAALGPLPDDVRGMVLTPNLKGFQRAVAAGLENPIFVLSMSESHNQSNVRRSVDASIKDLAATLETMDPDRKLNVRVGLATCFHCPFEGVMEESVILKTIERIVSLRSGMDYTISDTTGMATPAHVRSLAEKCIAAFGDDASFGFHGHDTAGFGVANILAAREAGVTSFDTAAAGLGGCPFAPGATGNIPSEDIVYLFERLGVSTGIDLEKLLAAGVMITDASGAKIASHTQAIPRARLFADLNGTPPRDAQAN